MLNREAFLVLYDKYGKAQGLHGSRARQEADLLLRPIRKVQGMGPSCMGESGQRFCAIVFHPEGANPPGELTRGRGLR